MKRLADFSVGTKGFAASWGQRRRTRTGEKRRRLGQSSRGHLSLQVDDGSGEPSLCWLLPGLVHFWVEGNARADVALPVNCASR